MEEVGKKIFMRLEITEASRCLIMNYSSSVLRNFL
jgi:hypothetical protein